MIVAARHGTIIDKRIHNCFFRRLHNTCEKRIQQIIGNCLHLMRDLIGIRDVGIRSGKGDE